MCMTIALFVWNYFLILLVYMCSSIASFLLLGGQDSQMYRQKKKSYICNLYTRASERVLQKYMYFQVLKYICIHYTINIVVWHYKWQYDWQNTTEKNLWICEQAERASLEKNLHLLILKLQFPSIFCWYFRYFVSETLYFQVSNYICIHTHTINTVSFHYLWYGTMI